MKKGDTRYEKSLEQQRGILRGLRMDSKLPRLPSVTNNANIAAATKPSGIAGDIKPKPKIRTKNKDAKTWIGYLLGLPGNDFLVEVDREYMNDRFNLTGLSEQFPRYQEAMKVILDEEDITRGLRKVDGTPVEFLEQSAEVLYGIIHGRFLLTPRGVEAIKRKYLEKKFGQCQRVLCEQQAYLPVGMSDVVGTDCVKLYCPTCQEMYHADPSKYQNCDGAFFGTGFPAMFFMTLPELRPKKLTPKYIPKLFGFKIHPQAIGPWKNEDKQSSSTEEALNKEKKTKESV